MIGRVIGLTYIKRFSLSRFGLGECLLGGVVVSPIHMFQVFLFNFVHVSTIMIPAIQESRYTGIFVAFIHPPHTYTGTARIETFWACSTTQRF
jgi:hypothetical protein